MVIKFKKWGRGEWTFCAAVRMLTFFGGVVVSSAASYHWAEKKLRAQFDQQLKEVKDYYASKKEEDDLKDDLLAKYSDADMAATKKTLQKEEVEEVEETIYDTLPPEQIKKLREYGMKQINDTGGRGVRLPHIVIIPQTDYFSDDPEFAHHEKTSLLYYEEDEVVVNPLEVEDEGVVENHEVLIGTEFTYNFANYGSGGRAYVRNTAIGMDYEIELVKGSFSRDEALGYEADMRDNPRAVGKDD